MDGRHQNPLVATYVAANHTCKQSEHHDFGPTEEIQEIKRFIVILILRVKNF